MFYSAIIIEKKFIYPIKHYHHVKESVIEFDLDAYLVVSIINTESGFNENAKSEKGAIGLMQIMPSTAEFIAKELNEKNYDLFDESINIRFGCFYLRYLLEKYKNEENAIIAYNAGEGRLNSWLKDKNYSKDGKTVENIPVKETREYVIKVKNNVKKYRSLYKNLLDKK